MSIADKIASAIKANKRTYDRDKDGKLSQWELKLARSKEMKKHGINKTADRLLIRKITNKAFNKADANKDGYVSVSELRQFAHLKAPATAGNRANSGNKNQNKDSKDKIGGADIKKSMAYKPAPKTPTYETLSTVVNKSYEYKKIF